MVGKKSTFKVALHNPFDIKTDRYLYLSWVNTEHWRLLPAGNPGWSCNFIIEVYNLFMLTLMIPWWIWLIMKWMSPWCNQFIISISDNLLSLTSLQSSETIRIVLVLLIWYLKLDEMVPTGCHMILHLDKHEFLFQC
jgi:hypothetical protein